MAASPTGTEMRTAALWGLRERPNLLHDGRAGEDPALRIRVAIEEHAGEAAASRDAWLKLSIRSQTDIIAFLEAI